MVMMEMVDAVVILIDMMMLRSPSIDFPLVSLLEARVLECGGVSGSLPWLDQGALCFLIFGNGFTSAVEAGSSSRVRI